MEQLEFLNGSLKEKEWKDSVVFLLGEEQGASRKKHRCWKDNLLQKYRMVPAMYGAADRNAFRTILCRHLADTVLAEKISENIRRMTERITSFPGWEMDVDLVDIYRELEALRKSERGNRMQLDENGVPFYRSMRKTEENTPQTTEGDIAPENRLCKGAGRRRAG